MRRPGDRQVSRRRRPGGGAAGLLALLAGVVVALVVAHDRGAPGGQPAQGPAGAPATAAAGPGTHDCVVVSGTLADPYSGRTVTFAKARAQEVPVDHVVPLAAAWRQGAAAWSPEQRQAFAGDVGNLLATTRGENSAKGDSTAEEWLPENPAFRCGYAAVVVTVKRRYRLSVTAAEGEALGRLLTGC